MWFYVYCIPSFTLDVVILIWNTYDLYDEVMFIAIKLLTFM